ncbi:MAG: phosphatidate cytidylyltransferase [Candidatus Promineifilaceae bacterium]
MLARRAFVALTLGPLVLLLVYLGGWFYFLPFAALLTVAAVEYHHMIVRLGWSSPVLLLIAASAALWLAPGEVQGQLFGRVLVSGLSEPLLALSLLACVAYGLWLHERRPASQAPASLFALVTGVLLLGWLGAHFFSLRGIGEMAVAWTSLAMLSAWIADAASFVFGTAIGRHALAPRLSPRKTVEGYLGGILVGTLATGLIGAALGLPAGLAISFGLLVSTLGPAGDLAISLLKRSVGLKDSGNILPGHGGALDRTDTLLWSVAIAFYLVRFYGS